MRTTQIAVISCLALSGLSGTAFAEDVFPTEPPLADSGWTVKYNGRANRLLPRESGRLRSRRVR